MASTSASQPAPKRSSTGRTCGCIAIAVVLLLLIGGGIAGYFLLQPSSPAAGPVVQILVPGDGVVVPLNQPLMTNAIAQGTTNLMRIELYADGALVAVEETTLPQGSNPLVFSKEWTPTTVSRHALIARAYTRDGLFADSNVVYINVAESILPNTQVQVDAIPRAPNSPLPSLNQVAQADHIPPDRLREVNPGLQNVNGDAPLPSGTTITVPPPPASSSRSSSSSSSLSSTSSSSASGASSSPASSSSASSVPGSSSSSSSSSSSTPSRLPEAPRAPTSLTGTGDCRSAQLAWVDSPDEERYIVYRLGPGDTRLVAVATLPANTVNYRDTFTALGTYRYQIASARGTLEGLTPMFVFTTPAGCPPVSPSTGTTDLLLSWISLETIETFDSVYCYFSIDGSPYERAPEWPDGFNPQRGNPRFFDLVQLPSYGMVPLPRHSQTEPVRLAVRCLGKRGLTTSILGTTTYDSPSADWRGTIIDLAVPGKFIIRFRIDPDSPEARRRILPIYVFLSDEIIRELLTRTPSVNAPTNVRYNPNGREACDQLPEGLFGLGRAACLLMGQPTITWDWRGTESAISGFRVEIDSIAGPAPVSATRRAVLVPEDQLERSRILRCGGPLYYSVIVVGADHADRARADNNRLEMDSCPTGPATVEVTFSELGVTGSASHRGHIEDDDTCILCTDDEMELFGDFQVYAGSGARQWDIRAWYGAENVLQPTHSLIEQLADALAYLADLPLRILRHLFGSCAGYTCVSDPGATLNWANVRLDTIDGLPATNRNILRVQVPDGASVTIVTNLLDGPTGFRTSNEVFCRQRIELAGRSAREWLTTNEVRTITQDNGEAACRITFYVRGVR